jgi:hypothetical protein
MKIRWSVDCTERIQSARPVSNDRSHFQLHQPHARRPIRSMTFRFNPVGLICAVVFGTPVLFTISYIIAALYQHVPWCFPPIDGCTTITETGTHAPESYIFRFGAYPLMTFQTMLFYFFKLWLERIAGGPLRRAQIAWTLALAGCVCMIASMAVMQGPNETAEPAHTILAVAYYLFMLASQSVFTYEDYRQRKGQSRKPLAIRIGTILLQVGLLLSVPVVWLLAGIAPNARYQWLIVGTFFLWYASFLFERKELSLVR